MVDNLKSGHIPAISNLFFLCLLAPADRQEFLCSPDISLQLRLFFQTNSGCMQRCLQQRYVLPHKIYKSGGPGECKMLGRVSDMKPGESHLCHSRTQFPELLRSVRLKLSQCSLL